MGRTLILILILLTPATVWSDNGALAHVFPVSDITIDGSVVDWPASDIKHPIDYIPPYRPQVDGQDLPATFRSGYDPVESVLYLLVEVNDDTLVVDGDGGRRFGFDGCSVTLDFEHGDRTPGTQFTFIGNQKLPVRSGSEKNWTGVQVAVSRTDSTHIYEWIFDLRALGTTVPFHATTLGFDIEVYDVDSCERRRPTRVSWERGSRKHSARQRGDLLLIPEPDAMFALAGSSLWKDSKERPAERVVFVAEAGWRLAVLTDEAGHFSTSLPSSNYQIRLQDSWLVASDTTSFDLTADLSDLTVAGTRIVTEDYLADPQRVPIDFIQRGVSWVAADEQLSEREIIRLVENNVGWIAQTPFGWQSGHNNPSIRLNSNAGWWGESDHGLRETTRIARKYGIKKLLKPHLWLNRSDGKWRGDIAVDFEADWMTWFDNYATFIVHYATLAEELQIEALCVGMELHQTATRSPQSFLGHSTDLQ